MITSQLQSVKRQKAIRPPCQPLQQQPPAWSAGGWARQEHLKGDVLTPYDTTGTWAMFPRNVTVEANTQPGPRAV